MQSKVCDLFAVFRAILEVAFQEVQCVARLFGDVVYLSFPDKLITQCDSKVLGLLNLCKSCPRELMSSKKETEVDEFS